MLWVGLSKLSRTHASEVGTISESNAISTELFPHPVGPTIILIHPGLKNNSPSILSLKLRLPGVITPDGSLAHVKVAFLKPMVSGGGAFEGSMASMRVSESYMSSSSVYMRISTCERDSTWMVANLVKELGNTVK